MQANPEPFGTDRHAGRWQRYSAARSDRDRDELIDAYRGFARMLAAKYFAQTQHRSMEFEDFMQHAMIGLMESIDRYDPERGIRFEAFAAPRIKGAILDGLEKSSEVQEQIAARRRVLSDRSESLTGEPEASNEDLFARLAEIAVGLAVGFMLDGTSMALESGESVVDGGYESVDLRLLMLRVRDALDGLPERSRAVIELHYFQKWTFEEVSRHLGVTKGRVSQIHKDAVGRLRAALHGRGDTKYLSEA